MESRVVLRNNLVLNKSLRSVHRPPPSMRQQNQNGVGDNTRGRKMVLGENGSFSKRTQFGRGMQQQFQEAQIDVECRNTRQCHHQDPLLQARLLGLVLAACNPFEKLSGPLESHFPDFGQEPQQCVNERAGCDQGQNPYCETRKEADGNVVLPARTKPNKTVGESGSHGSDEVVVEEIHVSLPKEQVVAARRPSLQASLQDQVVRGLLGPVQRGHPQLEEDICPLQTQIRSEVAKCPKCIHGHTRGAVGLTCNDFV